MKVWKKTFLKHKFDDTIFQNDIWWAKINGHIEENMQ